jgi:aryl-alcohol dehydrogenase-like predicted oxidoreductase
MAVCGSSGGQSTAKRQNRRPRRSLTPFRYEWGVRYRQLGSSDLQVSEIALGSWLTYGLGVHDTAARECVEKAFEVGINFIDTSNVYGRGAAETFLGDVLSVRPRESYILATKLFFPMDDTGENKGLSRQQVFKQIDDSLRRLRTDYVDLYQCHRYDPLTPLEETMEALSEIVRQGKVRYIGFSEWTAEQIQASLDLSPPNERFVSSQPQYSILWRVPEAEVIPLCAANGISQIVWSPLGQGVLTGKYRPGEPPPPDTRMGSEVMGWAMNRFREDDVLEAVQRLRPIADGLGITMAQLALAWVLREPNVAAAIIGATKPEQVEDNAGASGIELDDETLAAIDDAVADVVVHGPVAA